MTTFIRRQASTFVVDFGNVEIPSALAKEMETEFQQVALAALARIDFHGNIQIGRLPIGTYGMIFGEWPPDIFVPHPHQPYLPNIDVRDHTLIVGAAMDNAFALMRSVSGGRKKGRRFTGPEVLELMTNLPNLDAGTKGSIARILGILNDPKFTDTDLDSKASYAMEEINKQLDACETIDEIAQLITRLQRSGQYQEVDGLPTGIDVARRIIEDGRSTIYSPHNPFYSGPVSIAKENGPRDIGLSDVKGAIAGGAGGASLGPKGAAALAAAAGISASLAEAISQAWDAIFG
jgi:hypothetical protein